VGQNDGKGDGSTCATPALRIALATEHLLLRGCASLSREPSSPFLRPPSCSLSPNRFQPPRSSSTRGATTFPRTAAAAACRPAPHSASDGTACKSRRRANTSVLYASDLIGCPRLMHPSKVPNLESGRGRSAQPFQDTLAAVLPTQSLDICRDKRRRGQLQQRDNFSKTSQKPMPKKSIRTSKKSLIPPPRLWKN